MREQDGDPQPGEHAGEDPLEVTGTADLAVEGRAPVRPQDEEHHRRDQQHGRPDRPEAHVVGGVVGLHRRRVRRCIRVVHAEELLALVVERADERSVAVEEQQGDDYRERDETADEAPLLDLGVARHAERDQHSGDRDRDEADQEDAVLGAEPGGPARAAERGPQRLEQLDRQDIAVDRRPQPEDEPPAGRGHDEADAAAQDPGLPDVVAASARDRHDQAAVGDDQERNEDGRDDDRRDELALGERRAGKGELVNSQRDEVRRQARIDDGVPD